MCCPGVYSHWWKYGKANYATTHFRFTDSKKNPDALKVGETLNYSSANSPLKFTFYVTYSFKEDCETTNNISLNLFIKKVIGHKSTGSMQNIDSTPYFDVHMQFDDHYYGAYGNYYDFKGTMLKRP